MRKLVLVVSFVVACGGSSKSGGGGGVSGTVGGKGFSPVEVRALVTNTGASPCPISGLGNVGVSALAVSFTSYSNACGDLSTTQCRVHANAQNVTVLHALLQLTGTAPTLAPGTFTIKGSAAEPTIVDATHLAVTFAQAVATAAAPACTPSASPSVEGGTLTITSVTATQVTGSIDATFSDGGKVQGDFTADVCTGATPDICALASQGTGSLCQGTPTCVP